MGFAKNKSISDYIIENIFQIIYNKKVKENLAVFKYVIKVVIFLGFHELPFKGDNKGDFSVNKGAFSDMLDLFADDSPITKAHLNSSLGSNCKLTTQEIQNEILYSMLQVYRRKVIF